MNMFSIVTSTYTVVLVAANSWREAVASAQESGNQVLHCTQVK